jgi:hypothetical protein
MVGLGKYGTSEKKLRTLWKKVAIHERKACVPVRTDRQTEDLISISQ